MRIPVEKDGRSMDEYNKAIRDAMVRSARPPARSEMGALAARLRSEYRRATSVARKEYYARVENHLIEEAESRPYRWTQGALARVACPVPSSALRAHFGGLFAAGNTVPQSIPV